MKTNLHKFQVTPLISKQNPATVNLSGILAERQPSYINEFNLFINRFNTIPHFIHEIRIDCKKANDWFFENYKDEIYIP